MIASMENIDHPHLPEGLPMTRDVAACDHLQGLKFSHPLRKSTDDPVRLSDQLYRRIIRPHKASFDTFPTANKGDKVLHLRDDDEYPLWFYGRDSFGMEGFFAKGLFTASEGNSNERIALRDYNARELTVETEDTAIVLEEYGGWLRVQVATEEGWVPVECVETLERSAG